MSMIRPSRVALVGIVALGMSLPPAFAQHWAFSIEARQWRAQPAGSYSFTGVVSETLDFESDLGLVDDNAFDGRLVFRPSRKTMVRLAYVPGITVAGDDVVARSLTFRNLSFAVSERVVTSLDLEYAGIGFAWQVLSSRDGRFRIGPLLEAKGMRADLSIAAPEASPPIVETDRLEVGFGAAGLIADLEISSRIELFGEATVAVTGDEGDVTETEIGIRYLPTQKLAIVGGVRKLEIEIADTDERFAFELDGVFVGAAVRF